MAYPLKADVDTAVQNLENVIVEDLTLEGGREASELLRALVTWIDSISASTSYAAITQRTWANDDLYNGPND